LPLKIRGIHLPRVEDVDLLDTVTVGDVMQQGMAALSPTMSTAAAADRLADEGHHGLPVAVEGRLLGLLTLTDIRATGGRNPDLTVGEAMTKTPITVNPTMPVSAALARMAALDVGRMPVVADEDPRKLVGMFRRESVVHAYHQALGSSTDRAMYRQRLREKVLPGATFFENAVPANSSVVGLRVRDLEWPANATLVSIQRGGGVTVPHGDTVIRAGDTLTLFGTGEAREDVAWMMEPPPPEGP
ncbi:MAG: CBS domain-containing protein, partial [Acidimicrobiia bacterium]|nr:CBS domain-containing protein [Acidimicrobiia bacterium]